MLPFLAAACGGGDNGGGNAVDGGTASGGGGSGGGACKNVAICTVIPVSQVNSATGKTTANASPSAPPITGDPVADDCSYISSSDPSDHVDLLRNCSTTLIAGKTNGELQLEQSKNDYLAPGGTRVDLPGVGDGAFYQTEPSDSELNIRVMAYKGPVWVRADATAVTTATEAKVKQGLIDLTNILLVP